MADSRMYIGSRTCGLACRFYARTGGQYTIGSQDGMIELVQHMSEDAMDDRLLILHEGQVGERFGEALWKIKMETLDPEMVPASEVESLRERNEHLNSECIRLSNQGAALGRKLIDAQNKVRE